MTKAYELESLLRPPVELYSAASMGAGALFCMWAPDQLMMVPSVSYACAGILAAGAASRFVDGWAIKKYHRNLTRLSYYEMKPQDVPVSNLVNWIGRGFEWKTIHTQRMNDARSIKAMKYLEPGWFYKMARDSEIRLEGKGVIGDSISRLLRKDSPWNPVRPLPPVGGSPIMHGVEPNEVDVYEQLAERVAHKLVIGTTRVGKTRVAEIYISADIARKDGCTVLLDPKSDAGILMRMYLEAKRNGVPFYIFHLGFPDISCRYNAVGSFARISEVATRATSQLASEGNSAAFAEFSWRFVNIVAQARVAMGERPSYTLIRGDIQDMEPLFNDFAEYYFNKHNILNWQRDVSTIENNMKAPPRHMQSRSKRTAALESYIKTKRIFDPVLLALLSAIQYDKTYFDKLTASLLPFVEKVTSGRLVELVAPTYDPNDSRPIIDWMTIMRQKAVVYVGLDAMTDKTVAEAIGGAMLSDLLSTCGYLYKYGLEKGLVDARHGVLPKVYLHCDEFNELATDFAIPILNKSGGSGVQFTAYTQSLFDLEAKLGSAAKAQQMLANFNAVIMLRVKTPETAELLTKQLPEVTISELTPMTSVRDASDATSKIAFVSSNADTISTRQVPLLQPSDIIALPKGQAFALLDGSKLYKLRFPLMDAKKDNIPVPENIMAICKEMEAKYQTSDNWWDNLSSWRGTSAPKYEAANNPFADMAASIPGHLADKVA